MIDMEDYVRREDPHGLPAANYNLFLEMVRLNDLQYPPADAHDAAKLYKTMSVLA